VTTVFLLSSSLFWSLNDLCAISRSVPTKVGKLLNTVFGHCASEHAKKNSIFRNLALCFVKMESLVGVL